MTAENALHTFFSGFGIPAYERCRVPVGAELPYLTYDVKLASFGDQPVGLTVELWYRTEDNSVPNAKARQLGAAVGRGGVLLPCDGGGIWLKKGEPFCQSISDPTDARLNRRYINITAEYITE